jgi:ubiquinone/menaquinone biosynthesis C-methylase UbiE
MGDVKVDPRAYRGVPMEGWVARWYDANAQHERDDTRALALRIVQHLPGNASLLEVAPGPGYLAIELAKFGRFRITGLDISESFVQMASRNAQQEEVEVDFRHGNAADMPFQNDAFDFVVCRAALQNFTEPVKALQEMRRVLKPGGTAVVLDIRKDVSRQALNQRIRKVSTGFVSWLTNQFVYRVIITRRAYGSARLRQLASAGGFVNCDLRDEGIFVEMWLAA